MGTPGGLQSGDTPTCRARSLGSFRGRQPNPGWVPVVPGRQPGVPNLGFSGFSATACLSGCPRPVPLPTWMSTLALGCRHRRIAPANPSCRNLPERIGRSTMRGGRLALACASEPISDQATTAPAQARLSIPRFRYGDRGRAGSRDTRHSSVAHPGGHSCQKFTQSGSGAMSSLGRLPGSGRPESARRFKTSTCMPSAA